MGKSQKQQRKEGALMVFYKEVVAWCVDPILLSMSKITIHHPHDGFFKHSLSNLMVAKDFLQVHFSPSITQRIQGESLKAQ